MTVRGGVIGARRDTLQRSVRPAAVVVFWSWLLYRLRGHTMNFYEVAPWVNLGTPDTQERARGMPLAAADDAAACSFPGTTASLTAPRRLMPGPRTHCAHRPQGRP